MNENFNKSVKLALAFGFAGAVGIPLCYEIYANLSQGIALFLMIAGAFFAGVKFSFLGFKEAVVGFVFMLALTVGFSVVGFMVIHPAAVSFLEEHSRYFYITAAESFKFIVKAAAAQLVAVAVCFARYLAALFVKKMKENSEAAKDYINNAFDDNTDRKDF